MNYYRITKYNPDNRNLDGSYKNQLEWTEFMGYFKTDPTISEYLLVESAYISYLLELLIFNDNKNYQLQACEKNNLSAPNSKIKTDFNFLETQLRNYFRHIGNMWSLITTQNFCIYVSSDMYIYILSKGKKIETGVRKFENIGLYIEEFDNFIFQDDWDIQFLE